MSDETNEKSVSRMQSDLADEGDKMDSRLGELDDQIDDAKQKADAMRQQSTPDAEVPVGDADTADEVPTPAQEP